MEAPHGSHAFRKGSERAVGGVKQPDGKVKKKKRRRRKVQRTTHVLMVPALCC